MSSIAVLVASLVVGMLLRGSERLPENATATINGFITNVALPRAGRRRLLDAGADLQLLARHNGRALMIGVGTLLSFVTLPLWLLLGEA